MGKCTQESYAAVVYAIQLEWNFLQHVTKNTGRELTGVEKLLWENFCLAYYSETRNISHPS